MLEVSGHHVHGSSSLKHLKNMSSLGFIKVLNKDISAPDEWDIVGGKGSYQRAPTRQTP